MKIIDCHYHNSRWSWNGESYQEAFKKYLDFAGVETINLVSMPGYENGFLNGGAAQNIMAAILKAEEPYVYAQGGLIYPWSCEKNPKAPEYDPKTQVQELIDLGFDGIKMIESKPTSYIKLPYRIDSDYYAEFFSYVEEQQIPILWHVADPESFWDPEKLPDIAKKNGWFYGDGIYPSREKVYEEVYTILARHPRIKLILAHCMFLSSYPEQIKTLLDNYENICIDLTPGTEMYRDFSENREVWREILGKYYSRFMFGTDIHSEYDLAFRKSKVENVVRFFTTDDEFQAFGGTVRGLALDSNQCEHIFGKNFINFMGGKPRKINTEALRSYVQRHVKHIPEGEEKDMILKYCAEKL